MRLFTAKEVRSLKSAINKQQQRDKSNNLNKLYNAVVEFERKGKDTSVKIIE